MNSILLKKLIVTKLLKKFTAYIEPEIVLTLTETLSTAP